MKTIDRYIIRTFLINFAILFVVVMSLFVVIDLIVDLDEFLKGGQHRAGEDGSVVMGTLVTIVDYYGPVIVLLYVFLSGVIVTAAMGFTVSAMQRARELTAMVASGISMYRIAAPVVIAGIGLSALTLPCQELLIPAVAAKLARSKSQLDHAAIENFPVHYARDEAGNLIRAVEFDPNLGVLIGVTILERSEEQLIQRHITAAQATWDEQRQGWQLLEGEVTTPAEAGSIQGRSASIDFYATRLSPTVLLARRATIYPRLLPLAELQAMQSNEAVDQSQRNQITQIIWSRFSLLVVNVLVLVMGLPFFLLRAPKNPFVQSIKAAGVCLGAWGGGLVMLQVTATWVNPVAAAWLPVVIYLPLSALLLQTIET